MIIKFFEQITPFDKQNVIEMQTDFIDNESLKRDDLLDFNNMCFMCRIDKTLERLVLFTLPTKVNQNISIINQPYVYRRKTIEKHSVLEFSTMDKGEVGIIIGFLLTIDHTKLCYEKLSAYLNSTKSQPNELLANIESTSKDLVVRQLNMMKEAEIRDIKCFVRFKKSTDSVYPDIQICLLDDSFSFYTK